MAGRAGTAQYLYLTWHTSFVLHCQIFCSKLVNSLQQGKSMERADGSQLIKCLLSPHHQSRSSERDDILTGGDQQ